MSATKKKMSLGEILNNVDTAELGLAVGMSAIASLAIFISLSYLTGSSNFSTLVGLLAAPISLYFIVRKIAAIPRTTQKEQR